VTIHAQGLPAERIKDILTHVKRRATLAALTRKRLLTPAVPSGKDF
jgi:hypothetical protein